MVLCPANTIKGNPHKNPMENKLLVQVVALPTKPITKEQEEADNYASGYVYRDNRLYLHGTIVHLYLVSNEDIKNGDWVLIKLDNKWELQRAAESFPSMPHCKRIEATTDPAFNLPLIGNDFIIQYADSNGNIKEITIEMWDAGDSEYTGEGGVGGWTSNWKPNTRKNNTVIIIHPSKTSWSREEVEKEMLLFAGYCRLYDIDADASHDCSTEKLLAFYINKGGLK